MTETGFAAAAIDAAHAFRAIMHAMARPGSVVALDAALRPPAPLNGVSAAVALTLCDFQTPVWLSPALADAKAVQYLKFHTGAPVVERMGEAQFAFLLAEEQFDLSLFAQGTHEYPDRSATLVIQAQGFHGQGARLTGPGIKGAVQFGVEGIAASFWAAMAANHARFPVGADVIFAAPYSIAAVPRSSAIGIEETV
jgi:alpha-D-ribose 1-methylphosphonate 5-triphosphate synthase subunit PhnH